ncbi:hypothetical protein [Streptomyces sp. 3214.6]|uniref:hypothetical protein n=1 Tax=Streptomyces sp. 3214.6 TaxID=1882757 RepID=UPI0026AF9B9B
MATAVNCNTVWTAVFEPLPTLRFPKETGKAGRWEARHDLPCHEAVGEDQHVLFEHVGMKTFAVSVFLARRGEAERSSPADPVPATSTPTNNRYRCMRLKRIVGSHGANLHKAGVLCLAPRTGLGVIDSQARARVGEERLRLFRR